MLKKVFRVEYKSYISLSYVICITATCISCVGFLQAGGKGLHWEAVLSHLGPRVLAEGPGTAAGGGVRLPPRRQQGPEGAALPQRGPGRRGVPARNPNHSVHDLPCCPARITQP